jgi:hypothetical protein
MPTDPDRVREQIAAASAAEGDARAQQQHATVELTARAAEAETARRSGDEDKVAVAERRLDQARSAHDAAVRATREAASAVARLQGELADVGEVPGDAFRMVPSTLPILLLPVRLETRWKMSPQARELLVRIYPDEIHSDTFERELTDSEATWGDRFWEQTAAAATDDERRSAWGELVGRFGPRRGAWVAIATDPATVAAPESRAGAWTRAPRARTLPDRWVAVLTTDAPAPDDRRLVAWSDHVVPDGLATGPDPSAAEQPAGTGMPDIDPGMRWMVDFAEAEQKGMALRIPIPAGVSAASRLMVLGVKASLSPADGATRLEELLEAHHYTGGLALPTFGASTNNTGDADSGWSAAESRADDSYEVERGAPLMAGGDGSDGDLLARALGIDPAVLAHVSGAGGVGLKDSRAMNEALWPATWRYFLEQMMAETFPEGWIELGWSHFVNYVRGTGPLPALRAGRQPYGILPVTALDAFRPMIAGEDGGRLEVSHVRGPEPRGPQLEEPLADFLRRMRELWRVSLDDVPRVGRTGDPDQDLVELLGQDGLSSRYASHAVLGPDYRSNLGSFLDWNPDARNAIDEALVRESETELASIGHPEWQPRLLGAAFWDWIELNGPNVDGGAVTVDEERLSETAALDDNYISWLLGAGLDALRTEAYPTGAPPNALLYLVLRHSLLLALGVAATSQPAGSEEDDMPRWRENELVDIDPDDETSRIWDRTSTWAARAGMSSSAAAVAQDVYRAGQGADVVDPDSLPSGPAFSELRAVGAGLKHLEDRPTAVLERLFGETLDVGAHRLDAWITSLASKRLHDLRTGGSTGLCLGGYGWLENLSARRASGQPELQAGAQPDTDASNLGFVHAPSVGHAATAAVLRSAHGAHGGDDGAPLALDLTSRRVRLARSLLEGVRNGQPLGALLGYRFERALHEAHAANPRLDLDRFIVPFRRLAPLAAGKRDPQDTGAVEALAARAVVDGRALLEISRSTGLSFGTDPLPDAGTAEQAAIQAALDSLADATDALSDAVVAESVHQLVQGNTARAGATVEAIATGEAPPPELHVARTPRSGIGVSHRLALLFSRSNAPAAIDPQLEPERAREDADPELHKWAGNLLGPQTAVVAHATFEWSDEQGEHQSGPVRIQLSALGMGALDVVYASMPSEEEQRTELDQRVVARALQNRPLGTPPSAQVRLDYTRDQVASSELGFDELIELATAARDLITSGTPMTARDLRLPEEAQQTPLAVDTTDLEGRADRACERVEVIRDAIDPASTSRGALRAAILAAVAVGVQGAVPVSPVDGSLVSAVDGSVLDELAALQDQAKSIRTELSGRLDRIGRLAAPGAGVSEQAVIDYHLDRMAEALGREFRVVPRFRLTAASATELDASLNESTSLQDGDPWAAGTWLERAARVREGPAILERVLLYAAALGRPEPGLRVAQLPHAPGDRWVGLTPVAGRVPGGRLSLVLDAAAGFAPAGSIAGLQIDDWVEVVPSERETTGVAFHFDAPAAEPPQALLLAVHPDPQSAKDGWTLEALEAILGETLELAALRGVDGDALKGTGRFLPAAYFASNLSGHTVSSDFSRNTAEFAQREVRRR